MNDKAGFVALVELAVLVLGACLVGSAFGWRVGLGAALLATVAG